MKKILLMTFFVVTFFAMTAVSASAVVNDTIKVGLRYGDTAMFSANLENAVGAGYAFGYFDDDRDFVSVGWTEETTISMTASGTVYMNQSGTYSQDMPTGNYAFLGAWHVQLDGFGTFDEAAAVAAEYGGYPAWVDFEYVVRMGAYGSQSEAEMAAAELGAGYVVRSSDTGVLVTVTRTTDILFEFDASGVLNLGVRPDGQGSDSVTWFKGYKYPGAFEYPRVTGGDLNVFNVVDLEEYVKGVIPFEMNGDWPLAALEAQAVCARTYACRDSKHLSAYGFDVCATTDCQVYYGRGNGGSYTPTTLSDRAVENTAGERMYYKGDMIQNAVYHSSNGGATEDVANVWGTAKGYLLGKEDPYESKTSIPNYTWSVTYTASELTWILEQKGYSIGTVKNVYISEYTPLGNVKTVTFEGSKGTRTVSGDTCRTIFYSSTYNKSVKSMRFDINGSKAGGAVYVNNSGNKLTALDGVSVISGSGTLGSLGGNSFTVITSSGTSTITAGGSTASSSAQKNTFVITGSGSGHNVGMSQYGAKAMAELGYDYEDILDFYFTDITIK